MEADAVEGPTAQVVGSSTDKKVSMVATADPECCMGVHRIMLFTCPLLLLPATHNLPNEQPFLMSVPTALLRWKLMVS